MNPGIGLFAKPPVAGRVKTRLSPPLSPEAAAALYRAFLEDLAAMLEAGPDWDWLVYSTDPKAQETAWSPDVPRPQAWRRQEGPDLGARMQAALGEMLAESRPKAVLLGSDHPTVGRDRIRAALDALDRADVVLGPTTDGGYDLVGLSRPVPGLFDGVPWSSPRVLAATAERVRDMGLRLALLSPWYDVDTPADLAFLRSHLSALELAAPGACPRTRACLDRLPAEPAGSGS